MIQKINGTEQNLNFKKFPKTGAKKLTRQVIRLEQGAPKGLTSSPIHFDKKNTDEIPPFFQGLFGATWASTIAGALLWSTSVKLGGS